VGVASSLMNSRIDSAHSIESAYSWVVAFASMATLALAMGANYLAIVSVPFFEAEMGWSRSAATSIYSATTLGAGIGGIVMGFYASRMGVQAALSIAAVGLVVGCVLVALSDSLGGLLAPAFAFIGMLGMGTGFAPLIANVTLWFDRNRGLAIATVAMGQTVSGGIWNVTFEPLVVEYGWRAVYVGYGLFAACAIIPLSLFHKRQPPELARLKAAKASGAPAEERPVPNVNPHLLIFLLGMAIVGCCVAMSMPVAQMVAYCATLGYGTTVGAELASLLLICSGVSRLGFGLISDRIGGLNTILIGATMQAAALSLFIFFDGLDQLYLVSAIFGLVFGGIVPAYGLAVRELFPAREAQTKTGIIYFFGYVGMAGGGLIGGFVYDVTLNYPTAFAVGVAFNLVNIALILLIKGMARARPARLVTA
jgi:MFS family permease